MYQSFKVAEECMQSYMYDLFCKFIVLNLKASVKL